MIKNVKMKKGNRTYTFGIPLTNKNSFYVAFQRFPTNEDWKQVLKWVDTFGNNLIKPFKKKRGINLQT